MCKALATAFLAMVPMPKNDDHSDVSLGPLLDNFKDVKSDPRVQAHDNDSLRLMEEKFRVACTTTTTMAPARACRTARTMGATAIIRRRPSARRLMSAIGTRG